MKKDIQFPAVEGVSIAITNDGESENKLWKVYIINSNNFDINSITICTTGYGNAADGTFQETSVFRFYIESLAAQQFEFIELIDTSLFHLNNEYWVSYFVGNQIYDKKFIFVPESIIEQNLVDVPVLNLKAVLHN